MSDRWISTPMMPRSAPSTSRSVIPLMPRSPGTRAEIAAQFVLSEQTIKTHVNRIFGKLSLRDRAQAVVLAYETGLVKPASG